MKLEGYSDYEIYPETGQVWSYKRNRYIGAPNERGYIRLRLIDDNGNQHNWSLHRLIWTAVNGEIPEGMQVNHIDENKENNSTSNLNLMTNYDNCHWGTHIERLTDTMRKKYANPILGMKNGKLELYFPSTESASKNGFHSRHIADCCKGKTHYKQHKGYQWLYQDDYLADWWEKEMDKAL